MENWKEKYKHKINPEDDDFYGNEDCGCLSVEQIDEILLEQRQRMAREIEGKKKDSQNYSDEYLVGEEYLAGIESGLQAALNIVLGEGEKHI